MTKIISVSNRAYEILLKLKKPGQSFSGVIIEHLEPVAEAMENERRKEKE